MDYLKGTWQNKRFQNKNPFPKTFWVWWWIIKFSSTSEKIFEWFQNCILCVQRNILKQRLGKILQKHFFYWNLSEKTLCSSEMLPILSKETSTGWSKLLSSSFFPEEPLEKNYNFFRSLRRRNIWPFNKKQQYWQNWIVPVHENNFDVILHKQVVISWVFFRILVDNLKYSSKQNCAAVLILQSAHWEEQFSIK